MTTYSNSDDPEKMKNQNRKLTPAESSNFVESCLTKLPGFDDVDLNALVGRERLAQALDLEQKPDNRFLRLSLYLLSGAAILFVPLAALTPITKVVEASGQVVP